MAILGPHVCGALDLGAWSPSLLDVAKGMWWFLHPHSPHPLLLLPEGLWVVRLLAGRRRWVQLTGHCVGLQAPTQSLRALFPISEAEAAAPPGLHTD